MTQVHFRICIPGTDPENVFIPRRGKENANANEFSDPEEILNVNVDGHMCSLFMAALGEPKTVALFLNYLRTARNKRRFLINVYVAEPKRAMLDYKSNEMFEKSALERRELDHALAWFSTLGGAFSALGDSMTNCAIIAGKISTQQFKFALRLGDPNLQSRCRLYMALSQIQLKNFVLAKQIVKNEYKSATSHVVRDTKLISMCLGIWAKLKYDRKQARGLNKFKQSPTR